MAKKSKKVAAKADEDLSKKNKSPKKQKSGQKSKRGVKAKSPQITPDNFLVVSSKVDLPTATATFEHLIETLNELDNKPIPFKGYIIRRPELVSLSEIQRSGPINLTTLAGKLGLSKSAVLKNVNKLVSKGLATKTKTEDNLRTVRIEITKDGESLLQTAPDWNANKSKPINDVLSKMTEDELAFFNAALEKIIMGAKIL